jgi:hypothetical protein
MGHELWLLLVAFGNWAACSSLRDSDAAALQSQDTPLLHLRGQLKQVTFADPEDSVTPAPSPAPSLAVADTADLAIGTQPGQANVVSGYEVVSSWGNGADLAASPTVTDPATHFYIRSTGDSVQLTKATVNPSVLPQLKTYVDGELAATLNEYGEATLRSGEEHNLTLTYDCLSSGSASLILTLEFQDLSPVQIPITKTCGGQPNTALTVYVGPSGSSEKAVVMGSPQWDELKVIGVRTAWENFTLYNDPLSEQGAQVISTPQATGVGSCSAVAALPTEPTTYSSFRRGP